jgi:alpha-N-arabinofuranosidase
MKNKMKIAPFVIIELIAIAILMAVSSPLSSAAADARQTPSAGANAIVNPSFEDMDGAGPKGWFPATHQGRGVLEIDAAVAHSGGRSAKIGSAEGGDLSWSTVAPVKPYSKYRLSGWIKTQDVKPLGRARGALFNIHGIDPLQTKPVVGTQDWTRVELAIDTEANDALQINGLFGGWGRATGMAWFDDVRLELLSSKPMNPTAAIDAAKTGAPISKYIYGQFIEHLGRCIYQGIWAEMLEDRKFYYPVGDKDSPWKAVGDARNVRMNPIRPYVGVHAPEIRLRGNGEAGGIAQENLSVVKGKGYLGRIVLAADPGARPVRVSLAWGTGADDRQTIVLSDLTTGYKTVPLAFKAEASSDAARLEVTSAGKEAFLVGTLSLMPEDNVDGFRPDVLKVLKDLDSPVYRWPGGNFVSGYNWSEGLGDPDRRPPRKNPAWLGVEHNDVGIHEFLNFCRLLATDPYISVNSGQGDETQAADEVEYANGAPETAMGRLRAANGRPQPWGVKFWSIGNEMYGSWQLGAMPLADYTLKHARFAAAMRAKDPSIRLVAVGAIGGWSEGMLAADAGDMDLMSEHFYCGELPGLMGHVAQIPREVKRIADAHRKYRSSIPALQGKDIRIALDEWNYWYGPHVFGELGTRYFLKDGLGIAAGLHEYFRQSDIIYMANYAQTVNVIGAVKTTKTAAEFESTGLVLKLYRAHYGTIPIKVGGAPEPLDVAAAWKDGKKVLTVAIVNPTREKRTLPLTWSGVSVPKTAKLYLITGTDPQAFNDPGKEPVIKIQEIPNAPFGNRLTLPPMSVSLYEVRVAK